MRTVDIRTERRKYQDALGDEAERTGSLQQRLEAIPSTGRSTPKIPQEHAAHWNRKFIRERARLVKLWLLYDDAEAEVRETTSDLADERERARQLRGIASTHEEEVARLADVIRDADASNERLRARVADQVAALDDADEVSREFGSGLAAHEEEVLRLREALERSDGEATRLQSLATRLEDDVRRLRHRAAAREDEARYARSVLQVARAEPAESDRIEGQLGVGPLFDRWDRLSGSPPGAEPFREGPFTLYEVEVAVAGGGSRTFYFFARNEPQRGRPVPLPSGYEVDHNPKNGLPYLRKER